MRAGRVSKKKNVISSSEKTESILSAVVRCEPKCQLKNIQPATYKQFWPAPKIHLPHFIQTNKMNIMYNDAAEPGPSRAAASVIEKRK